MAQCKQCGGVLEAKPGKEAPAYCSEACRKKYARQHRTPPQHRPTPDTAAKSTPDTAKRGADIQCFEDLPSDVQRDIELYSRACEFDGVKFTREQNRQARIARAICYQHLFLERYHQRGNSYIEHSPLPQGQYNRVSKPGDSDYDGPKGPGVCRKCGAETQSPLITCCYPCAIGKPLQVACEPAGANV